jgi:hypothetical protein
MVKIYRRGKIGSPPVGDSKRLADGRRGMTVPVPAGPGMASANRL